MPHLHPLTAPTTPIPLGGPLLLIAPHPDDETLGAGGLLSAAAREGQAVWVVFVTVGDAFPWNPRFAWRRLWQGGRAQLDLGRLRMAEAREACARLGVPAERALFLGFPDRGLSALVENRESLYRSPDTGADAVPYRSAYAPGFPYTGNELARELREILRAVRPAAVLAPGPLDNHADHRAVTQLVREVAAPLNIRSLYYIVQSDLRWPWPKGYRPDLTLPPPGEYGDAAWLSFALGGSARRRKAAAIRAYASQVSVWLMGWTLWAFLRRNELFLGEAAVEQAQPAETVITA